MKRSMVLIALLVMLTSVCFAQPVALSRDIQIKKSSATEVEITQPVTVSLTALKNQAELLKKQLANLEVMLAQKSKLIEQINKVDLMIAEAEKQGVVEKEPIAEPIEPIRPRPIIR